MVEWKKELNYNNCIISQCLIVFSIYIVTLRIHAGQIYFVKISLNFTPNWKSKILEVDWSNWRQLVYFKSNPQLKKIQQISSCIVIGRWLSWILIGWYFQTAQSPIRMSGTVAKIASKIVPLFDRVLVQVNTPNTDVKINFS